MPSEWKKTSIYGCFFREIPSHSDIRGTISKLHGKIQDRGKLPSIIQWSETIQTESQAGVIRGLHVPNGSKKGWKLSSCVSGKVNDVLLDLRSDSPTYLKSESRKLTPGKIQVLVAPGVAHGIESINNSIITYFTELTFEDAKEVSIDPSVLDLWEVPQMERLISSKDQNGISDLNKIGFSFSLLNEIREIVKEVENI